MAKNCKKEFLLSALLTSPSIRAAAELAGIPEATAYRMLRDSDFSDEYQRKKREMVEETQTYLKSCIVGAAMTLDALRADAETPPPSRVSACRALLEYGNRAVEQGDILQRITELENLVKENDTK